MLLQLDNANIQCSTKERDIPKSGEGALWNLIVIRRKYNTVQPLEVFTIQGHIFASQIVAHLLPFLKRSMLIAILL